MTLVAIVSTVIAFVLGIRWAYNAGVDHGIQATLLELGFFDTDETVEGEQAITQTPVWQANGSHLSSTRRPTP